MITKFKLFAAVPALLFLITFSIFIATAQKADATPVLTTPFMTFAADNCPKPKLLGIFVPWYQYLEVKKDTTNSCLVKDFNLLPQQGNQSDVPAILLAVVDDMLRLAGLAAVIFVIYGGVMYTTSQGSPEATAKAQSTVQNALIGLVVALVAVVFVSYIGKSIGISN